MKRSLVALAALWVAAPVPGAAGAACPAPVIEAAPTTVSPGDLVEVRGRFFFVGCFGSAARSGPRPEPPDLGIRIRFLQDDVRLLLGRVDAGRTYRFAVTVQVPAGARAGAAVIEARGRNGDPKSRLTIEVPVVPPVAEIAESPAPLPTKVAVLLASMILVLGIALLLVARARRS